jgi:glycosyltransferase involved in cell wall biosynthesis
MKILVFTDWFYPGSQAGGPIQSLISMMKFSSDCFFVITRDTDLNSSSPYDNVRSNSWQPSFQDNIQVYYLNEDSMNEDFIYKIYNEIEPDRIYLNSMWSPKFTLLPLKVCRKNFWSRQVFLAPRGMLKPAAIKQKGFKKKLFLLFAKFKNLYSNIVWHATSEIEQEEILQLFPKANIRIAPNISNAALTSIKKELSVPFRILTVGRISPEKGYYEALDAARKCNPNKAVQWDIIGLKENSELVNAIQLFANDSSSFQITLHGHKTPDELQGFYEKAHLFFMPSRGENYGHAIAEALCFGTPVAISNATPWKNLEEQFAGKTTSLNPMKLAESLDFFFNLSKEDYQIWSEGALKYASQHVNSNETLAQNKTLFG